MAGVPEGQPGLLGEGAGGLVEQFGLYADDGLAQGVYLHGVVAEPVRHGHPVLLLEPDHLARRPVGRERVEHFFDVETRYDRDAVGVEPGVTTRP
jgi:hypothetical protein